MQLSADIRVFTEANKVLNATFFLCFLYVMWLDGIVARLA